MQSVDPLDNAVRIRFNENASRSPAKTAFDDKFIAPDNENSPFVGRKRSFSISQDTKFREALTCPGREPGIDLNFMATSLQRALFQECQITVVDYCKEQYATNGTFTNQQFLDFIDLPKPQWSKVRWINVNGMSFDVLKKLTNTYSLTPLAVEDALHFPTRTKIDHYSEHSYVCLPLLILLEQEDHIADQSEDVASMYHRLCRWLSPKGHEDAPQDQDTTSEFQTSKHTAISGSNFTKLQALREYHFPKSTREYSSSLEKTETDLER